MNGKAILLGGNSQSLDNIAGQPIAEYVHTKSGTVHKLEGPAKAKNIVFKATGDYNDGDTWTLNNTPVTVTYNGGEELLPTAVLVGDVVQAVVMGNQVKLMLQKPIPQPNILYNWYFVDPVNQKGQKEYTGGYNIDRWSFPQKVELTSEGISLVRTLVANNPPFSQKIPNLSNYTGKTLTFSVLAKTDKPDSFRCSIGGDTTYFAIKYIKASEDYMLCTVTAKVEDSGTCLLATIQDMSAVLNHNPTIGDACHLVAAKLEPGNRFTGWPAWDYGAELEKCQRYYFNTINKDNYASISTSAFARTNNRLISIINAPVSMRIKPVPKIIGKILVRNYSATVIKEISEDIASIHCYSSLPWALNLDITLTDGTTPFTAGEYYNLIIETMSGNYLEFNANL